MQGGGVNAQFAEWLARVTFGHGRPRLPASYIPRVSTTAQLCEAVFPCAQLAHAAWDPDFFERRAILAIRNDQLPPLNEVPGDAQTFYSVDSVSTEDGDPVEEATSEYLRLSLLTILTPLPITAAS